MSYQDDKFAEFLRNSRAWQTATHTQKAMAEMAFLAGYGACLEKLTKETEARLDKLHNSVR